MPPTRKVFGLWLCFLRRLGSYVRRRSRKRIFVISQDATTSIFFSVVCIPRMQAIGVEGRKPCCVEVVIL
jgi:hypothetical protein